MFELYYLFYFFVKKFEKIVASELVKLFNYSFLVEERKVSLSVRSRSLDCKVKNVFLIVRRGDQG